MFPPGSSVHSVEKNFNATFQEFKTQILWYTMEKITGSVKNGAEC